MQLEARHRHTGCGAGDALEVFVARALGCCGLMGRKAEGRVDGGGHDCGIVVDAQRCGQGVRGVKCARPRNGTVAVREIEREQRVRPGSLKRRRLLGSDSQIAINPARGLDESCRPVRGGW
jgi:hypothetical protein